MPLVGENRVIAKLGLQMLSKGPHKVGLRALLDVAGLTGKQIDSYHIAFMLAPRVNAAGRMSTPDIATRLLLAADEGMADEARGLAEQLEIENTRRRQEEQDIVAKARKVIETDPEVGSRSVLVVAGEGWHRGVIGIVASKIVDAFYRPTIVLSIEDGIAHGSCRSIPGFDMLAALESCAPMLLRFGGHKQAAGLQIESARIKEFRQAVNVWGEERLGPDDLRPRLWLDGPLAFGHITSQVAEELTTLAPFGPGNPKPVFHTSPVQIVDGPRKLKDRHLKMSFRQDEPHVPRHPLECRRARRGADREEGRRRAGVLAREERVPGRDAISSCASKTSADAASPAGPLRPDGTISTDGALATTRTTGPGPVRRGLRRACSGLPSASGPSPPPSTPIERLDPKATSEIRGGDVLQHKGTKRDIKVEFGSQMSYADGRSQFTSFKAHIDDRGGRSFVISGTESRASAPS